MNPVPTKPDLHIQSHRDFGRSFMTLLAVLLSMVTGIAQSSFPHVDFEQSYWIGSSRIEDVMQLPNGNITMLGTSLRITTIDPAGRIVSDAAAGTGFPRFPAQLGPDGSIFAHGGTAPVGKYIVKYSPDQQHAWTTNYLMYYLHFIHPTDDGGAFLCVDQQILMRLNSDGSLLWAKPIPGGPDFSTGSIMDPPAFSAMEELDDGGYIIAATTRDGNIRVVRLKADALTVWDKTYGGAEVDEFVQLLVLDSGFVIGGTSRSGASGSKTDPSEGRSDVWLLHLDDQGNITRQAGLGAAHDDIFKSVARTPFGYAVLADSYSTPNGRDKTAPVVSASGQTRVEWLLLLDHNFERLADQTYGRESSEIQRRAFLLVNPDSSLMRLAYPHKPNIRRFRLLDPVSISINDNDGGVLSGKMVELSSAVSSEFVVSYQWTKNNEILFGATNNTFRIPHFTAADTGNYAVLVSNQWGVVKSQPILISATDVEYRAELVPALSIEGIVGQRYKVESAADLDVGPWRLEAEITLTNSPQRWLDLSEPNPRRFYRVERLP